MRPRPKRTQPDNLPLGEATLLGLPNDAVDSGNKAVRRLFAAHHAHVTETSGLGRDLRPTA
jgi:hypothetical protein